MACLAIDLIYVSTILSILWLVPFECILSKNTPKRTFTVDLEGGTFVKDGRPFQFISGSMHHYRVLEQYWPDRMKKFRMAGLNAIQTYIEWSSIQPEPDLFDFTGNSNITKYFELAKKYDLLVIVRPSPFIDSERDNSGLPYWLASINPSMHYRTTDPSFLKYVTKYYDKMLPKLVPYLYENGGPIIMAQIENEYGSFPYIDPKYKIWHRDIIRKYLGNNLLLFTVDGLDPELLARGNIENVYPTADFFPSQNITDASLIIKKFTKGGPLANMEYYPGWEDSWGYAHCTTDKKLVADTLDQMLSANYSVNFYPFHGGTSFGFMNGALIRNDTPFKAYTTSYDYDAPITEDGRLAPKYFAIKNVIKKHFPDRVPESIQEILFHNCQSCINDNNVDDNNNVMDNDNVNINNIYDEQYWINKERKRQSKNGIEIRVDQIMDIFALMNKTDDRSIKPIYNRWPLTFEQLHLRFAFIYYRHVIDFSAAKIHPPLFGPIRLNVPGIADRALVFLNDNYLGTLSRMDNVDSLELDTIQNGDVLGLFVETMGRDCCPTVLPMQKGINGNVTLAGIVLEQWQMYPMFYNWSMVLDVGLELFREQKNNGIINDNCQWPSTMAATRNYRPSFYLGTFTVPNDTDDLFLDVRNFGGKGTAFINGFNLGRYWPDMGPQITLYVPKYLFRHNEINVLQLFELERTNQPCAQVSLIHQHILTGKTRYNCSI